MSQPKPALVSQRAAARLPRWALIVLCAVWTIPGLVGRDPWRNADVTAFGLMAAMAEGRISWWSPTLGGVPVDTAVLSHWMGAAFMIALQPWVDPALASRLPFAVVLAFTMAGVWNATFHLARTEAALPVAFAFGGEASAVDYARAIADGALLALLASLGLLQLGHETTPEVVQLGAATGFIWALARAPFRQVSAQWAVVLSLAVLSASGAPFCALILGVVGAIVCWRSRYDGARQLAWWALAAAAFSAGLGVALNTWAWRFGLSTQPEQWGLILRLWVWFPWPVWPLALWTLWRWRQHWGKRHLAIPLSLTLTVWVVSTWMGGSDRALMLALPGLAILAAFSLPTLQRAAASALDWFSMCFFSAAAAFFWAMYIAMVTGKPQIWADNIRRLAPNFEAPFHTGTLLLAVGATAGWLALIRWRTAREPHPLWKSMVLPAGGVALCWLLLMTLWLPLLDFARSSRPGIASVKQWVGAPSCVAARGMSPAMVASWEVMTGLTIDARAQAEAACPVLVQVTRGGQAPAAIAGWEFVGQAQRPTDRNEMVSIYRR